MGELIGKPEKNLLGNDFRGLRRFEGSRMVDNSNDCSPSADRVSASDERSAAAENERNWLRS